MQNSEPAGREQENRTQSTLEKATPGRFYFVVEEKVFKKNGYEEVVSGNLHGTVSVDDEIYILQPGGVTTRTVVKGLETKTEDTVNEVQSASDMPVRILLDRTVNEISQFSVITNVCPQEKVDVNSAVENPIIAGLLYEFGRFTRVPAYVNRTFYAIAHGHFLTPILLSKPLMKKEDGTTVAGEGTAIGFAMLPNQHNTDEKLLPVFTDWEELNKWTGAPKNKEGKVETLIVKFPDITAITRPENCGGFVINPFSKNQILMNKGLIQMITQSEGYQKEFNKQEQSDKQGQEQSDEQGQEQSDKQENETE